MRKKFIKRTRRRLKELGCKVHAPTTFRGYDGKQYRELSIIFHGNELIVVGRDDLKNIKYALRLIEYEILDRTLTRGNLWHNQIQ